MPQALIKVGGGLVYCIPQEYADRLGWQEGTVVQAHVIDGQLVIGPVAQPNYSLDQLLEGITSDNLHRETGTGLSIGNET